MSKVTLLAVAVFFLSAVAAPGRSAAGCRYGNIRYDQSGYFLSADIYRGADKIGSVRRLPAFDTYHVFCPGVSEKDSYTSANHAAWAACSKCR